MTDSPTQAIKRFIEERRAIEKRASSSGWYVEIDEEVDVYGSNGKPLAGLGSFDPADLNRAKADADFIADSRQSVPVLLAMVEEMAGALQTLRVAVNDKQPDPGAVMFIDTIFSKVAALANAERAAKGAEGED